MKLGIGATSDQFVLAWHSQPQAALQVAAYSEELRRGCRLNERMDLMIELVLDSWWPHLSKHKNTAKNVAWHFRLRAADEGIVIKPAVQPRCFPRPAGYKECLTRNRRWTCRFHLARRLRDWQDKRRSRRT